MVPDVRTIFLKATRIFCVLVAGLSMCIPEAAQAQCLTGNGDIQLSERSVISLITVSAGREIQTFWGHTALRIQDPAHGLDLLYNYGTFQFDATFVPKFLNGGLDYMLCASHMRAAIRHYREKQRSLIEQKLQLSLAEKQAIFDFVEENALPENRTYRYDFLFDNCSTRILDLMEQVLGSRLAYHSPNPDSTYRQILQKSVQPLPVLSLGIDVGLGLPVDRKPTARELMGLPPYMLDAYDRATVEIDGRPHPLVFSKTTLLDVPPVLDPAAGERKRWVLIGVLWFIFVLAALLSLLRHTALGSVRVWFDRVLFGFTGLLGILAAFLWFVSAHKVTNVNFNLLWAWPLHVLIWFRWDGLQRYMQIVAIAMVIVLAGWPFWPQSLNNMLLPVVLALLLRSARQGWKKKA